MKTYPIILLLTLPFIMAACYKWDNPYDADGDNPGTLPEVTTTGVTNVTATTAVSGGNITSDGGLPITARGVCWATTANPTIAESKTTNGTGTGVFTSSITGLTQGITYYVRAYATNSVGTVYGNVVNFITKDGLPLLTTTGVTNVTATTAVSGGNITADGGFAITARGVCWATTQNPTTAYSKTSDGTGIGNFTSSLTALTPNTTYYVRAYSTNSVSTVYGKQQSFTTQDGLPLLTTTGVTNVTATTAVSGGNITSDGGLPITARGVCWATTQNPTTADSKTADGTGTGVFTSSITGLTQEITYYVRAYATNSVGTVYGNVVSFSTLMPDGPGSPITDNNGNTYNTVWIGGKLWMAENLKTTKYNDGTAIPNITDAGAWDGLTTPGYCWYNNDIANKAVYGALYNFYAVNTGKLAPAGWHVPTDAEWQTMVDYLGGNAVAGGKLKEAGFTHWASPNTGATNSSGFTALPGGYRYCDGTFDFVSYYGYWWSSTEYDATYAWFRSMTYYYSDVYRFSLNYQSGFSVRCLRD